MSSAAARKRRYRRRQRDGLAVFRIEVDEHRAAAAFTAAGWISEAEALDKRKIEQAGARLFQEYADRWLGPAREQR
jgi:hypothetical protein